jgi:hypothetical protein
MSFKWLDRRTAHPGPYLTLVRSEADYIKALKHCKATPIDTWIKTPHANATCHNLNHADGSRCSIVAIRVTTQTPIEIAGLLVHESVHIVQDYFDYIGEHTPGREQQAYATQGISQELMTEYARQIGEKA